MRLGGDLGQLVWVLVPLIPPLAPGGLLLLPPLGILAGRRSTMCNVAATPRDLRRICAANRVVVHGALLEPLVCGDTIRIVHRSALGITGCYVCERGLPHLRCEQLFGDTCMRLFRRVALRLATCERPALERRCAAIKHKYWLDTIEEKLEDPPQESKQVCIRKCAPLLVPHGHLEVVQPDGRVNRKALALE